MIQNKIDISKRYFRRTLLCRAKLLQKNHKMISHKISLHPFAAQKIIVENYYGDTMPWAWPRRLVLLSQFSDTIPWTWPRRIVLVTQCSDATPSKLVYNACTIDCQHHDTIPWTWSRSLAPLTQNSDTMAWTCSRRFLLFTQHSDTMTWTCPRRLVLLTVNIVIPYHGPGPEGLYY